MSFSNLKVQLPNSPDSTTQLQERQDDRIDREAYSVEIINDYDQALEIIDKSFVGSGQAHTAGPTNGNPQVQASHAHVGPGHAQANSTHAGPVYAGQTNGNPQAQAGHAHAGQSQKGQV